MMSTFDQVANIIAETCDIPRDTITPESHAIDDLGIDSLDFLDIAFAIDKAFGIGAAGSGRRRSMTARRRAVLRPQQPLRPSRTGRRQRARGRVITMP